MFASNPEQPKLCIEEAEDLEEEKIDKSQD